MATLEEVVEVMHPWEVMVVVRLGEMGVVAVVARVAAPAGEVVAHY